MLNQLFPGIDELEHTYVGIIAPQNELVSGLAKNINEQGEIDVNTKIKLASVIREHYKKYPQALDLQASGNTIPSTVSNPHASNHNISKTQNKF